MESLARRSCGRGRGAREARGLGFLLLLLLPAVARPADLPRRAAMVGLYDAVLESSATSSLRLAMQKLESPRCQQLFSEFADSAGQPLRGRLDALGHTPGSFLEALRFSNGRGALSVCGFREILAATVPNSRVVYLCGPQFSARQRVDPAYGAAMLIHEELHTLGLAENPPSSRMITARVLELCGH